MDADLTTGKECVCVGVCGRAPSEVSVATMS